MISPEERIDLQRALARLPPMRRMLLERHIMGGLGYHELGAELDLSRTRIWQLCVAALEQLRLYMIGQAVLTADELHERRLRAIAHGLVVREHMRLARERHARACAQQLLALERASMWRAAREEAARVIAAKRPRLCVYERCPTPKKPIHANRMHHACDLEWRRERREQRRAERQIVWKPNELAELAQESR